MYIIIIIIIIIITNEKIKVMLSRKRCRGTLQDYNMSVFLVNTYLSFFLILTIHFCTATFVKVVH